MSPDSHAREQSSRLGGSSWLCYEKIRGCIQLNNEMFKWRSTLIVMKLYAHIIMCLVSNF